MANENLAIYLNDHLAGSVVAIELLERLEAARTYMAPTLAQLRADIEADRAELRELMRQLQIAESRPRKVTGWITEKFSQLKLRLDDPAGGSLRLLESLELVALGIQGKLALWRALARSPRSTPRCESSTMNGWLNARRTNGSGWKSFGWKRPKRR